MLWAAATMCFFGFLRVGEVVGLSDLEFDPSVHLSAADVSVNSHSSPTYTVCCSQYQGFQGRHIQVRGDDLPGSDTWCNMSGGRHAQIYGREGPIEGSTVPV